MCTGIKQRVLILGISHFIQSVLQSCRLDNLSYGTPQLLKEYCSNYLSAVAILSLGALSKMTPSTRRGGQFFQLIGVARVASLSIERTDHYVLLKASCCLRTLAPIFTNQNSV